MYRSMAYLPVALLFIAIGFSDAQTERQSVTTEPATTAAGVTVAGEGEGEGQGQGTVERGVELERPYEDVVFEVRHPLALHCTLPNDKGLPYVWTKNGTNVNELADVKERYELAEKGAVWKIKGRSGEDDFGNYTCGLEGGSGRQAWRVRAQVVLRVEENVNVVEKQTLKIQCKVIGKPHPAVWWTYNSSQSDSGAAVTEALGDRVRVDRSEQGVEGALLVVSSAERTDAGWYSCHAAPAGMQPAVATAQLRVKDMYAALWPFLGICAEVVVLCAIILVYEKRRTKPELDDSDTDNHDQKKS